MPLLYFLDRGIKLRRKAYWTLTLHETQPHIIRRVNCHIMISQNVVSTILSHLCPANSNSSDYTPLILKPGRLDVHLLDILSASDFKIQNLWIAFRCKYQSKSLSRIYFNKNRLPHDECQEKISIKEFIWKM